MKKTANIGSRFVDDFDQELEKIKKLNSKQLIIYAHDEYGVSLTEKNGRLWLEKKTAYMVLNRYKGPLKGRTLERAEALDTPERIAELRKQGSSIEEKKEIKTQKRKARKASKMRRTKMRRTRWT